MIGKWTVEATFYFGPEPAQLTASALGVGCFGNRYVEIHYFQPDGFSGRALLSFDPDRQVFQSTWIDTMKPAQYHETGARSATDGVVEIQLVGNEATTDSATGKSKTTRSVYRFVDHNNIEYRAWGKVGSAKEQLSMTLHYKRL